MRTKMFIMTVSVFLFSQYAASAVVWDESTDGDLSSSSIDPVLALSVGTNEVRGSDAAGEAESDSDPFQFVIPNGTILTSVSYAFSNYEELGIYTNNVHEDFQLHLDFTAVTGVEEVYVETDPSPANLFASDLPLTDGTYKWVYFGGGFSGHASEVNQAYWDYSIVFTVTAVPIPAAFWLFSSALLGLGVVKRNMRRL